MKGLGEASGWQIRGYGGREFCLASQVAAISGVWIRSGVSVSVASSTTDCSGARWSG